MKKNFFYVVDDRQEVVDCSRIYSFIHEENAFKRILARI